MATLLGVEIANYFYTLNVFVGNRAFTNMKMIKFSGNRRTSTKVHTVLCFTAVSSQTNYNSDSFCFHSIQSSMKKVLINVAGLSY